MKKILIIISTVILFSCNIFNPVSNEPKSNDAKITEAEVFMHEGKYKEAEKILTEVIASDSTRSKAYYLRGKSTLRANGIDIIYIWNQINPKNESSIPFLYKPGKPVCDAQGHPKFDANNNIILTPSFTDTATWEGQKVLVQDSVFNSLKKLHGACKSAFNDLLKIERMTKDGTTDGAVSPIMFRLDYSIESFLLVALELLADFEKDGKVESQKDKEMYLLWCDPVYADFSDIENINIDSIKTLAKDPNRINIAINSTLYKLDSLTTPSLSALDEEILNANNSEIDTSVIADFKKFTENISENIRYYKYNDKEDNDKSWYDSDGSGDTSHMIWIDYDKDGLIDIDTSSAIDSKDVTYGKQIGDSVHYNLNPSYYPDVKRDSLGNVVYYTFHVKNSLDTIRMIQFNVYKGPIPGYGGEWISGDWGIDEEIMDGIDNDRDGRVDEDTRITEDIIDNDSDWVDTNGDNIPNKMIWIDLNHNGVVDDSLGNPLPANYKGGYNGEFTGGDYGVDEEIFDGVDNDNDGKTDEDISGKRPLRRLPYDN